MSTVNEHLISTFNERLMSTVKENLVSTVNEHLMSTFNEAQGAGADVGRAAGGAPEQPPAQRRHLPGRRGGTPPSTLHAFCL